MFPKSQSDHKMTKRNAEKFIVTKAITERFRKSAIPSMQRLLNKDDNNQEFQRGFSLVYLHYIDLACSPSDYIPETSKFFCMLLIPIRTWNPRQFAIGGYFILRTEAGEYVFISLIANEVLEDEQRICT